MSAFGQTAGPPQAQPQTTQPDLSRAIQDVHAALQAEPEPADKAKLAQALMLIQDVQLKNQGEGDAAAPPSGIPPMAPRMPQMPGGPLAAAAASGGSPSFGSSAWDLLHRRG